MSLENNTKVHYWLGKVERKIHFLLTTGEEIEMSNHINNNTNNRVISVNYPNFTIIDCRGVSSCSTMPHNEYKYHLTVE